MTKETFSLAVFGCGHMATAVVTQIHRAYPKVKIQTYTPSYTRAQKLAELTGGVALKDISELKQADFYLLACKPQQIEDLASSLKDKIAKNAVVISVLAATAIEKISSLVNHQKIARVMPNTPMAVGQGINLLVASNLVATAEKEFLKEIFSQGALAVMLDDEKQLDDLTVFAGSGPGYLFEIARIMVDEIVALGYREELARELIAKLFLGASHLMVSSDLPMETLRQQVSSKGGVTQAALESFSNDGLQAVLARGFVKARERIEQLK